VLFVTGEAGIGKTTVEEAFLAGLAETDTGSRVANAWSSMPRGRPKAFGWLCRTAKRARLIESLRHYAPTWLAQMHALLSGAEREALKREILGATRERMLREMSEAVEALAAGMPLVLVLEDLHCSDYATLGLIASLARRQAPARLLFIGTYRPGDVLQNRHPLQTVKQEFQLHDLCAELPLAFLSEAAIVDFVAARFPESRPPAGLTRLIRQRTEGNPLLMVNVLNYLVTQGLWVEIDGRGNWRSPSTPSSWAYPKTCGR
jgi:predicted ATPase